MSVVGTLAVKIVGDSSNLDKSLNTSQANIKKFGLAAAAAVGAAAVTLGVMVRRTINAMDEMSKASQRIGVSVENLSALKFQADFAGVSMQQLEGSILRLSRTMAQANDGNKEARDIFERLGITTTDTNGKLRDTHEVMLDVADAFQKLESGAQKTALAQQLFRNTSIVGILNEGSEGMKRSAERAQELGVVMSTEMAQAAEQFNDNITASTKHLESFTLFIANKTLPTLNSLFDRMALAAKVGLGTAFTLEAPHFADPAAGLKELMSARSALQDEIISLSGQESQASRNRREEINFMIFNTEKQIEALETRLAQLNAPTLGNIIVEPEDLPPSRLGKDSTKDRLEAVRQITKEFERERNFQLEIMGLQDKMAGMTKDQAQVQQAVNDVLIATSRNLQDIADKRLEAANAGASQKILDQFDTEARKIEEMARLYVDLAKQQKQSAINAQRQFSFGWKTAFEQFAEDSSNSAAKARDIFSSLTSNLNQAIGSFVNTGKLSFSDLANSIIKDIIRIELQAQVSSVLSQIVGAVGGAIANFSFGAQAGLGGATAAGIGSTAGGSGAVSFPVSGGAVPAVPFADGGFTGKGTQFQPAGVVHKGEFVLNAAATRRIGLHNLERMSKGFADGGMVGGGGVVGGVNINIRNEAGADGYKATAQARQNSDGGLNIDVMVKRVVSADMQSNGALSQQMASTFGLRRAI